MGFPNQKKKQILEALEKGELQKIVCKRYGVSPQTIRNWQKSPMREAFSEPHGSAALQKANSRIHELENLMLRLIDKLDKGGLL